MKLAKVPNDEASKKIPFLISEGIADPSAKICKGEDSRYVPIFPERENDVRIMGLETVDGEAFRRETRSPQDRIKERLAHLPDEIKEKLPMRWEFVGDIVIIRLQEPLIPYGREIGEAYAKELNARTVCADIGGVSGEFRQPSTELLFGERAESVRTENGIRYKFDVTRIMFASGNIDERDRMRRLDCRNETVVDMFAGIGYFTLPIAKFAGAEKVIACEKNPDSFHYLCENISMNNVENVIPVLGDNRDLDCKDADRVIMGYIQTTSSFLEKAKEMVKKGGIIHYHDTFYVHGHADRLREKFSRVFGDDGYEVLLLKEVKSYAPTVSHYVADVRIL